MKRTYLFATFAITLLFALPAQHVGAATDEELEAQVRNLTIQVTELQTTLTRLLGWVQSQQAADLVPPSGAPTQSPVPFTRALSLGMSGDDVRELQQFLAEDSSVYPEGLVTGYYGPLTGKAVDRFRQKMGIIGGQTVDANMLTTLNDLVSGLGASSFNPPGGPFSAHLQEALDELQTLRPSNPNGNDFEEDVESNGFIEDSFIDDPVFNDIIDDFVSGGEDDETIDITVEIRDDETRVFSIVDGDNETFFLGVTELDRVIGEIAEKLDLDESTVRNNMNVEYTDDN